MNEGIIANLTKLQNFLDGLWTIQDEAEALEYIKKGSNQIQPYTIDDAIEVLSGK